jgi:hypothetical protein
VDTVAPATTIVAGPKPLSNDRSPVLQFKSDDETAGFECRLDEGEWRACTSPWALRDLADGVHRAQVRAVDQAGNRDATPAIRTFEVDATSPQTLLTATLAATPASPQAGMDASRFTVSGGGVAGLGVSCPAAATSPCDGELAVDREVDEAKARASALRTLPVASTTYSVAPGQTKVVGVTLPKAARWLLERTGRMAAIVRLTPRRGRAVRRPVVLRTDPKAPRFPDAGRALRVSRRGAVKVRVRCLHRCTGALVLKGEGKRLGSAQLKRGTVTVPLKRRLRGTVAATVLTQNKRVDVTLTSEGKTR